MTVKKLTSNLIQAFLNHFKLEDSVNIHKWNKKWLCIIYVYCDCSIYLCMYIYTHVCIHIFCTNTYIKLILCMRKFRANQRKTKIWVVVLTLTSIFTEKKKKPECF